MPFRRRSSKRMFKRRKLPTGGKSVNFKQTKAIVHLQKQVKSMKNMEPKYVITETSNTNLTNATPTTLLLNGMAQGDTNTTRDANRIRWNSLELRFIFASGTSLTEPHPVRMMLVRKIPTKGATITLSNLIGDASPDFLDTFNVNSIDFKSTYKVYWDKHFMLYPQVFDNSASATSTESLAGGPSEVIGVIRTKLGGFITDYGLGNAGTVADIDMNGLFLITFTDNSTADAVGHFHKYILRGSEL